VAAPPRPPQKPGAPQRPGGVTAREAEKDSFAKAKREKDELEGEAQAVEEELEELKAKYDQYFLGIERRAPHRAREELKKRVLRLKSAFTRNAALKFKVQSLHARYLSYERLWLRSTREKEEGTYRRDLFKAKLRAHHDEEAPPPEELPPAPEDLSPPAKAAAAAPRKTTEPAAAKPGAAAPAVPAAAAKPGAPKPAAPARPASPSAAVSTSGGGMSENQMRALYNAYLAAKMTCREDVSKLTYDAVARSVSKQIPELITRYKAKSVEFKVEVKDGKAVLKAVPKI
jgi:hypothetical protein